MNPTLTHYLKWVVSASLVLRLLGMFFRVQFVKKPLRKISGIIANTLQIVEVFGRNLLQNLSHTRHGKFWQTISHPPGIYALQKVLHQLPPLGLSQL